MATFHARSFFGTVSGDALAEGDELLGREVVLAVVDAPASAKAPAGLNLNIPFLHQPGNLPVKHNSIFFARPRGLEIKLVQTKAINIQIS
jgi:hypothetical protein